MSTENKNAEKTLVMTLVSKIAAALKLGDEGKLQSFFTRMIRENNRQITNIGQNIEAEKISYNHLKTSLEDKLEDAKQALEDAYMHVDISRIGTNADQDAYRKVYLDNIERAEMTIDKIEADLEDLEKSFEESIAIKQKQIDAYELRNAKLKG
jgi:predicted  nucleic acid-binding Zn-ribbon protein